MSKKIVNIPASENAQDVAPAEVKTECPFERAGRETVQQDHNAGTPAALLARILALETKVFGTKHPAVAKASRQIAKIEKAKAAQQNNTDEQD